MTAPGEPVLDRAVGVHQLLPSLHYGDAIGNLARRIRSMMLEEGRPSEFFSIAYDPRVGRMGEPGFSHPSDYFRRPVESTRNVLVYHQSSGHRMLDHLARRDEPKVLYYHNVTPPEFFDPYDPKVAEGCRLGRRQLPSLRHSPAVADSQFNADDLLEAGYESVEVVHIPTDPALYRRRGNDRLARRLRATKRGTDLLFVGRLAPNKRIDDLLKVYATYLRLDPGARLFVVGAPSVPAYHAVLTAFRRRLGLDRCVFVDHVTDDDLVTYYRHADLFLCLSEHEGFCVPLVEAMGFGVPIVAYAAGAVPETLGGAGVLLQDKAYADVAEVCHAVASDEALRASLVAGQHDRARAFLPEAIWPRFRGVVHRQLEAALQG